MVLWEWQELVLLVMELDMEFRQALMEDLIQEILRHL